MRRPFDPQTRLDLTPISGVVLNLNCRDEIIPILMALQHIYGDPALRREILDAVGRDVNTRSSRKRGRRGMDYWQIIVLAAVRLGCNLDYDKLQDLAEQHRTLRQIMGIGSWDEEVHFDWRRIRDNLCRIRPATLAKINQAVVAAGHRLVPDAATEVRGDTFVVETDIHYPTDSSLIGDGLRKILDIAAELAQRFDEPGWRQHRHWRTTIKQLLRAINQAARSKGTAAAERLRQAYRDLLAAAKDLLNRAGELAVAVLVRAQAVQDVVALARHAELLHFRELTLQVCDLARRRVLEGEVIPNEDKIFSLFEPHTELIKRNKQPNPIQFGHNVLVIEDQAGFVCHYEILAKGQQDVDVLVPAMRKTQQRLGGKIERASFDRGFHSPANQAELAKIVRHPCLPMKGTHLGREQQEAATVEFREARQHHPGVESAIAALQAGNGLERCRDCTALGYQRYVGLGILGRNLHVLGKILIGRVAARSPAATTKRKRRCA